MTSNQNLISFSCSKLSFFGSHLLANVLFKKITKDTNLVAIYFFKKNGFCFWLTDMLTLGVAVSYSWDFLIYLKICETIKSCSLCCEVVLYIKVLTHTIYQFMETCSPFILPFKKSWVWFFDSFSLLFRGRGVP